MLLDGREGELQTVGQSHTRLIRLRAETDAGGGDRSGLSELTGIGAVIARVALNEAPTIKKGRTKE
jgi:hypothetical protein